MSMTYDAPDTGKKLTGWHVLAIFVQFLGTKFYLVHQMVTCRV